MADSAYINAMKSELTILLAEDDENDIALLQQALRKNNLPSAIQVCRDGEEAIKYLSGIEPYHNRQEHPFPGVVFLDIKLPKRSGLEVLAWIRSHPNFRVLPVMLLTSSRMESDIAEAYELGANAYIVKPSRFEEFQQVVKLVYQFWASCEKPRFSGSEETVARHAAVGMHVMGY